MVKVTTRESDAGVETGSRRRKAGRHKFTFDSLSPTAEVGVTLKRFLPERVLLFRPDVRDSCSLNRLLCGLLDLSTAQGSRVKPLAPEKQGSCRRWLSSLLLRCRYKIQSSDETTNSGIRTIQRRLISLVLNKRKERSLSESRDQDLKTRSQYFKSSLTVGLPPSVQLHTKIKGSVKNSTRDFHASILIPEE